MKESSIIEWVNPVYGAAKKTGNPKKSGLKSALSVPVKGICILYNINVFILSFFKAFIAVILMTGAYGFYTKLYTPTVKPYYDANIAGKTVPEAIFNLITSSVTWGVETVLTVLEMMLNWVKDGIPEAMNSIVDLIKGIFSI